MRIGASLAAAPCTRLAIVNWVGLLGIRGNSENFTASGTLLSLLEIIAEKMNTCLELVVPPDMLYGARLDNGSWTGMMAQLVSREVNMTGVPMFMNPERSSVVDTGFPLLSDSMDLAYMRPVQQADLSGFVKPFTPQVWGTLLASLMTMLIGLTIVQVVEARRPHSSASGLQFKSSPGELWWAAGQWTMAAPLAQSWWREPRGARVRSLAGAWLLFSFVLGTVYRSNLKAMLILPRINFPFNSLEELTQTDIPCYVMEASVAHVHIKNSQPGTTLYNLRRQLVPHRDVPRAVKDFLSGKQAAITSYFTILAVTQGKFDVTKTCEFYSAQSLFRTHYLSLVFPKGSKLKQKVDMIVSHLKDAGIVDHLLRKNFYEARNCLRKDSSIAQPKSHRPLALGDLYGVFSLYGGGVIVAVLTFVMELCLRRPPSFDLSQP